MHFKGETVPELKHHTIEEYGTMEVYLHAFILEVDGGDGHLHVPRNLPFVPIEYGAEWAPEPVWVL